jgi:hypothetical protein
MTLGAAKVGAGATAAMAADDRHDASSSGNTMSKRVPLPVLPLRCWRRPRRGAPAKRPGRARHQGHDAATGDGAPWRRWKSQGRKIRCGEAGGIVRFISHGQQIVLHGADARIAGA